MLQVHLQLQFKYELFHIYFTSVSHLVWEPDMNKIKKLLRGYFTFHSSAWIITVLFQLFTRLSLTSPTVISPHSSCKLTLANLSHQAHCELTAFTATSSSLPSLLWLTSHHELTTSSLCQPIMHCTCIVHCDLTHCELTVHIQLIMYMLTILLFYREVGTDHHHHKLTVCSLSHCKLTVFTSLAEN